MHEAIRPLVSIIIASYNHADYVEEAIQSALNQTYDNIQLIVIDDASTDDSAYKIKKLQEDAGFIFLQNEQNIGLQRSLDRAIREVRGEYLGWFASDDILLENKVDRQVEFIQKNDLDGVYSTGYVLYPDNVKVYMDLGRVESMFKEGTYLKHVYVSDTYGAMFQSGLFKTKVLMDLSYIRERYWSDDWAMTIKLLENYRIGFLNEPLFLYRQHGGSTFKKYWITFSGRVQVISQLTPLQFRHAAFGNLFSSQADYLAADGHASLASRFYLASLVMDFSFEKLRYYFRRWLSQLKQNAVRFIRKVFRLSRIV